jgi:hypothetical protein
MPDIKTALEQALAKTANAWAADDEAHQKIEPKKENAMPRKLFETTNNVTRATFDYVHQNPGKNRKEIANALEALNFKRASTTSLLGQFVRNGSMILRGDLLFTTVPEYTPIKSSAIKKAKPERKKVVIVSKRTGEVIPPASAGIAALPATREEKPWEPSDVIDKLTVRQALALFKELRNILVG